MPVCAGIVLACAPRFHHDKLRWASACALQIFKRFHAAYVDAVCNPFYSVSMVRAGHGSVAWLHHDSLLFENRMGLLSMWCCMQFALVMSTRRGPVSRTLGEGHAWSLHLLSGIECGVCKLLYMGVLW